ncbi:MAG: leucine-rich repeat protein [Gemmiger sp.]
MAENGLVIENGVLTDGRKCVGDVTVPEGVTEIAPKAFYNNRALTGLTLPEGLVKIGKFAVGGCPNLSYVRVPDSLTEMGENALMCKFESDVGFTHVMENKEYYPQIRCRAGSWIDGKMQELKASDNWQNAHGTKHIVEIVYL